VRSRDSTKLVAPHCLEGGGTQLPLHEDGHVEQFAHHGDDDTERPRVQGGTIGGERVLGLDIGPLGPGVAVELHGRSS